MSRAFQPTVPCSYSRVTKGLIGLDLDLYTRNIFGLKRQGRVGYSLSPPSQSGLSAKLRPLDGSMVLNDLGIRKLRQRASKCDCRISQLHSPRGSTLDAAISTEDGLLTAAFLCT